MHRQRLLLSLVALAALTTAGCSSRLDAGPRPNLAAGEKIREELKKSTGGEAAPAEEEAAGGTASGWGTLSGVFLFDGVAPKPAPIIPDKDAEVCGKHPLFNESIEVGPGGGLENMVIWLRTPKVPVNPKYDSQAGKEIELDNKDCRFQPHVVLVRTNETLKIKNSDPVGHNSKLEPAKNPAFNSLIPTGQSADIHLTSEETLPIKVGCSIHPWMGGWIVARADPYAAISDKDGHFTIADLPAGKELEFQLWQEKVGAVKEVEVEGVKVDAKGRFKLKLSPDEDKKLTFKVSLK